MAAWPIIIPIIPPTIDKITDSNKNWLKISDCFPPIAFAMPISFVLSETITNITFIIPIPETNKVIAAIAEKIQATGPNEVSVIVKGIGSGRDSAIRSLINHGFTILSIKDATPVPHNGPRPVKTRRV